ncbi:MAG: hypothetical protein M3O02_08935 [Acidobacteriota bacterium]|nr:hypothetical protein [Acidobacteriota bacterium]
MVIIRLILTLINAVLRVAVAAIQAGISLLGLGLLAVVAVGGILFGLSSLGVFGVAIRRRARRGKD